VSLFLSICLVVFLVIPCFVKVDDSTYLRYLMLYVVLTGGRISSELSDLKASL
jgi:hypothetical protein